MISFTHKRASKHYSVSSHIWKIQSLWTSKKVRPPTSYILLTAIHSFKLLSLSLSSSLFFQSQRNSNSHTKEILKTERPPDDEVDRFEVVPGCWSDEAHAEQARRDWAVSCWQQPWPLAQPELVPRPGGARRQRPPWDKPAAMFGVSNDSGHHHDPDHCHHDDTQHIWQSKRLTLSN